MKPTPEWGPAGRSRPNTMASTTTTLQVTNGEQCDTFPNTTTVLINGAHDEDCGEELQL